jgi:hypothetical protein
VAVAPPGTRSSQGPEGRGQAEEKRGRDPATTARTCKSTSRHRRPLRLLGKVNQSSGQLKLASAPLLRKEEGEGGEGGERPRHHKHLPGLWPDRLLRLRRWRRPKPHVA